MTKSRTHSSVQTLRRPSRWPSLRVDPLTGMLLEPQLSGFCFADGDDDDPPESKGRSFTAEEVEAKIKARLKKADKENAALTRKLELAEKSVTDLSTKFDTLTEKFDATNKSDVEKELAKTQRILAKLESERDAAQTQAAEALAMAEQAAAGLTKTKLESTLRDALRTGKAHGPGMDQAVSLMLNSGATFDEDGSFQMTIDDVPYDKPAEAAAKWLETNSHFREGAGGGSGTPRGGGNTRLMNTEAMEGMSPAALISEGLKSPSS